MSFAMNDFTLITQNPAVLGGQPCIRFLRVTASLDDRPLVFTCSLTYGAILAETQGRSPSVLQLRSHLLTPEFLGPAVLAAIHQAQQELSIGALVSIDTARARLRLLPLRE